MSIGKFIIPQPLEAGVLIRPYFLKPPPVDRSFPTQKDYSIVTEDDVDQVVKTTYLGTPVFSNLIFDAEPDTPENFALEIDTVLMTVDMTKNLVLTPLQGKNGTVKEYISDGDYLVDIRGEIISELPNVYPKDLVTRLVNLCKVPHQLNVSSFFLQLFSVSSIVVQRYEIAEKLGSRNSVPFTIQALSDTPIELQIQL